VKLYAVVLVAVLVLGVTAAHATPTLYLYNDGLVTNTLTVAPGASFDLWVRMFLETDDTVLSSLYSVMLPESTWSLTDRDYTSYGWVYLNGSVPQQGASYPVAVTDGLWDGTTAGPDFHFEGIHAVDFSHFSVLTAGWHTTETFGLSLPSSIAEGTYYLSLVDLGGSNGDGDDTPFAAGPAFELTVDDGIPDGVVPEPGTLALFGLGMAALVIRGRKRAA